ncbi:hypothetical protein [Amycolatopsis vastitatis]|nr:hypothetical protein [Amycolatopsis vastitatis]
MTEGTGKMSSRRQSIGEERYSDADADLIRRQIGGTLLAEIGARNFVGMEDGLMFAFGPTRSSKVRKIIVKLNAADLYVSEVGYLKRPEYSWDVVDQAFDVHVDALRETVRRLAARGLDV